MNGKSLESLGPRDFRKEFITNCKDSDEISNIEAVSNCYANYKILGVVYSTRIMNIISEYENKFCNEGASVDLESHKEIFVPEPHQIFYRPKNFYTAQNKVGFKFINFVRSSNSNISDATDVSILTDTNDNSKSINVDNSKLFDQENNFKITEAISMNHITQEAKNTSVESTFQDKTNHCILISQGNDSNLQSEANSKGITLNKSTPLFNTKKNRSSKHKRNIKSKTCFTGIIENSIEETVTCTDEQVQSMKNLSELDTSFDMLSLSTSSSQNANINHVVNPNQSSKPVNSDLLKLSVALQDSPIKNLLKQFQNLYIEMKAGDEFLRPTEKLINTISSKSQLSIHLKHQLDVNCNKRTCEIIVNESVLIGKGSGSNKKQAMNAALCDFNNLCTKEFKSGKPADKMKIDKKNHDTFAKLQSDNKVILEQSDAEMFNLPFLDNFYLLNHNSSNAMGILRDSFNYFKMSMNIEEVADSVEFVVNNFILARMPLVGSFNETKLALADIVLKEFQKSKWTLLRNTRSLNTSDDSIVKGEMYGKNTVDMTKINSSTNIGGQLMLKMGWNGDSGLGKSGSGIKDPIVNESSGKRQGIGFNFGSSSDKKSFTNNVSTHLRNWLNMDEDDILFDRDFDSAERAIIHKECRKLGVCSKSYNNSNGDRVLVVSKCREPQEMFNWVQSKGGQTRLYGLLAPDGRQ